MDIKTYWKEASKLLKLVAFTKEEIKISEQLKIEIVSKMLQSIKNNNFLIAKLLIHARLTNHILINFLFYNAINKERIYNLYLEYPSKYCNTYMFNLLPQELPDIQRVFSSQEIISINLNLNIDKLVSEIGQCDENKLKSLFPRAFNFSIGNPYSFEIY